MRGAPARGPAGRRRRAPVPGENAITRPSSGTETLTGTRKARQQCDEQRTSARGPAADQHALPSTNSTERLGQQLPDDARAGRADCGAHGDLATAHRRPRQQNARDVRTRNQQHDGDDRHQQHEERGQRRREGRPERATRPPRSSRSSAPPCPAAGIAISNGNSRASAAPIAAISADACARDVPGLRRRADHQPAVLADRQPRRLRFPACAAPTMPDGNPEVRRQHAHPAEPLARDADDGEGMSVQPHGLPDDRRIGRRSAVSSSGGSTPQSDSHLADRCRRRRTSGPRPPARRAPERSWS